MNAYSGSIILSLLSLLVVIIRKEPLPFGRVWARI